MSLAAKARALAGGAVRFVSGLIAGAVHPFVIINQIRQAYRGMSMAEVGEVYQTSMAAYSSAQELLTNQAALPSPLDEVTVNPYLFGNDPQGNRFRYGLEVQYQIPGEEFTRPLKLNIDSPDPLSLDELRAIAQTRFEDINYPLVKDNPLSDGDHVSIVSVTIGFAERRY